MEKANVFLKNKNLVIKFSFFPVLFANIGKQIYFLDSETQKFFEQQIQKEIDQRRHEKYRRKAVSVIWSFPYFPVFAHPTYQNRSQRYEIKSRFLSEKHLISPTTFP
ncbi:MAG: hypothetical protein LBE91_22100, partial [Tannerella sp.]|nr:hypothetical protein [Tannerella sp.]